MNIEEAEEQKNLPRSPQEWAERYLKRGYQPVRIPRQNGKPSKNPNRKGWQEQRYTSSQLSVFQQADNVGLNLGTASNGLADVDLDTEQAVAVAPYGRTLLHVLHGDLSAFFVGYSKCGN